MITKLTLLVFGHDAIELKILSSLLLLFVSNTSLGISPFYYLLIWTLKKLRQKTIFAQNL